MYRLIIISIFLNILIYSNAVYLGEQSNYYKPRLERNNILNKGLWMKDKIEKSNYGDFIFRAYSGDVDNLLQNNFDAFGENFMDTIPVFSSYVERNKRSAIHKQNQQSRKSLKKCKDKMNCLKKKDDKQIIFKSKFISKLRPASVFNDYPYEVAVLLANSNKREVNKSEKNESGVDPATNTSRNLEEGINNRLNEQNKTEQISNKSIQENVTITNNSTVFAAPKRRMAQSNLESDGKEQMAIIETNNETKYIDGNKINRNVFDKEERIWQIAPIQNMVLPRPENSIKNKPVTEKGLVKILSLLTKTFRKVMKQHNEIQEIDNKLHSLNEEFMKNVAILDTKFQEFDNKYTRLIEMNDEMQRLNDKFIRKNEDLEHKEDEISKNIKEFENQQKTFLSQQHQFYTIQKFMLEQNEKINRKQSLIAKTQSEISHRQNNFARILKKAKQFYMDKKFLSGSKLNSTVNKSINSSVEDDKHNVTLTTPTISVVPVSTDSMKINLFSIPKISPILNHDSSILEEKNYQPVDDLVYKYYFNNTFIDNLMKSKVLTAVIDNEAKNTRNAKSKRDDLSKETTILLPVGNTNDLPFKQSLHRERRWIRHPKKVSSKFNVKETTLSGNVQKNIKDGKIRVGRYKKDKNDPFLTMAINFCNEVGQNEHEQMFNWCIEKSLRKLKSIDMLSPIRPLVSPPVENTPRNMMPTIAARLNSQTETTKLFPLKTSAQTAEPINTSSLPRLSTPTSLNSHKNALITEKSPDLFFPDNDELESNLKQYDLKPDPEGTVYFDGSVHTSDIVISESDALSDIMPGLDSNSHVDVDPLALDLQARRRAYVRRLNENIMKNMNTY